MTLAGCSIRLDFPSPAAAPLVVDGSNVRVKGLHCFSTGEVIASGFTEGFTRSEGVIFLSEDRGETWRRISLRAPEISLSLMFLPGSPEGVVYASGWRTGGNFLSMVTTWRYEPGPWWVTRDKGRFWQASEPHLPLPPATDTTASLPAIVRVDQEGTLIGFVAENKGVVILRSTDSGKTWGRQSLPKISHYGSLVSNGRGQIVVTGDANSTQSETPIEYRVAAYRSSDSGVTWQEISSSSVIGLVNLRLYLTPGGTILAYNAQENHREHPPYARISRSVDGGRTWKSQRSIRAVGRIVGIAGNTTGRVVGLTSRGAVLLSRNEGDSWQVVHSTKLRTESSNVIFSNNGAVLATQDRGRFIRSLDGGETWHAVESGLPDREYLLDAHCTDGKGLIVVGGTGGMVTRSTDWGATWRRGWLQSKKSLDASAN